MDYLGHIVSKRGSPAISHRRWIDLIREHPSLEPAGPREAINPFTKEPMTIRPRPDFARVVFDGKEVGSMSWDEEGSHEIAVFGEPEAVEPLAREIAESLGGRFKKRRSEAT